MISIRSLVLWVAITLCMGGCGSTPVADDVSQREANEIVALLRDRGIASSLTKGRGSKARYTVAVGNDRFADAAGILSRLGLPSDKKPSFQELTAPSGIIPASREVEALRLDRAAAAELEELLKTGADIAGVSVLVRLHSLEGKGAPTATVVIQKRPGGAVNVQELRDITARAVPGIRPDDVLVSLTEASEGVSPEVPDGPAHSNEMVAFLGFSRVPAAEYNDHVMLFVALAVFVAILAGLGGYLLGQFNWIHRQSGQTPEASADSWLGEVKSSTGAEDPGGVEGGGT